MSGDWKREELEVYQIKVGQRIEDLSWSNGYATSQLLNTAMVREHLTCAVCLYHFSFLPLFFNFISSFFDEKFCQCLEYGSTAPLAFLFLLIFNITPVCYLTCLKLFHLSS